MIQALLVGLTVAILGFIECWFCIPMVDRPLIVGTAIGIVLGDVKTGVEGRRFIGTCIHGGYGNWWNSAAGRRVRNSCWYSICNYSGSRC